MAFDWEQTINNLFKKANAEGVTKPEKEMLENKAFELMAKYGVQRVTEEDKDKKSEHYPVSFTGSWVTRQVSLFNVIAKHFNCTLIDATRSYKHGTYYVFGFDSDVDSTLFLYTILENQMLAELSRVVIPYNRNTKSYRNSWLCGYINRINERLAATKKSAEKEAAPGYAVALRDRSLVVRNEVTRVIGKTKKTHATYRGRDAFGQGSEAGDRASFHLGGNDVNSSGRKEIR